MAKIRIRHKDTEFRFTKIKVINGFKGKKLNIRFNILKSLLVISLIANGYLYYLLKS